MVGACHKTGHIPRPLTTSLQLHQAGPQVTELLRLWITLVDVRTKDTIEALCGLNFTPDLAQKVRTHQVIRVGTCDVLLRDNGGYGACGHDVIVNHLKFRPKTANDDPLRVSFVFLRTLNAH